MEDFYADDLVNLWKFQDTLEGHALVLLKNGTELGVYAMSLELARLMARQETITPDDIDGVKDRAIKIAHKELEKRLNARGTNTTK